MFNYILHWNTTYSLHEYCNGFQWTSLFNISKQASCSGIIRCRSHEVAVLFQQLWHLCEANGILDVARNYQD